MSDLRFVTSGRTDAVKKTTFSGHKKPLVICCGSQEDEKENHSGHNPITFT